MIERVKLDYFLVDCAENKNGELLIFEADNTAVVHNMDSPELYPYKPPQMRRSSKRLPRCCSPRRAAAASAPRDKARAKRCAHAEPSQTLDPQDWDAIRAQGHRMLDDMLDYVANVRERPVWQPIPDAVRARFRAELPREASELGDVYSEFTDFIAPYATGNVHPGFMGWVHGGGTAVGMLAEMLAAGLNANLGGRDHIPIEVERQIVEWTRQMFGFPGGASGIFVTGTSMANLMAVLVARTTALGQRSGSAASTSAALTAYTSNAAHGCIAKAMDIAGFGSDALREHRGRRLDRIDVGGVAPPDCAGSRRRPQALSGGRLGGNGGHGRDR